VWNSCTHPGNVCICSSGFSFRTGDLRWNNNWSLTHAIGVTGRRFCDPVRPTGAVGGRGSWPGWNSTLTTAMGNDWIPIIIQHELTHNLGAAQAGGSDPAHCGSDDCILGRGELNRWCTPCENIITRNRRINLP